MAKVLIVDDEALNRILASAVLTNAGHQAVEAADAIEALAIVRADRPDLVICDIAMPTMDGYAFVRQLRAEPEIARTEVIFYSAIFLESEARDLARSCGVSHVLMKPCDPQELLGTVHQVLGDATPFDAGPIGSEFDREHLRLVTDKLVAKAGELERANQRLSALTGALHHAQTTAKLAHVVTRPDGSFEDWSETLPQLIGMTPADMPKSTREWLDILHPDDRETFRNMSIAAGASGMRIDVEYRLRRADDAWVNMRQAIEPIPGTAGPDGKMRWFCTLQDVTEQKKVETKVKRLNRVYAVLSGINSLIVRVRDREELFREACRIAVDAGAFRMAWIGVIDPQTLDGKVVATHGEADGHELYIRLTARDGMPESDRPASRAARSRAPVICNDIGTEPLVEPMRDELLARGHKSFACLPLLLGGKAAAVLGLLAGEIGAFDDDETRLLLELAGDIAFALDHIEKEEKLNYLAYYDSLTGLANNTLLHERLEQYISAAGAEQQKLALVLIDVERFKTINDTFGRHMGDVLLQQVAERLIGCVQDRKQLARVGADHFAVVVPGVQSEGELVRMLDDKFRQCFQAPYRMADTDLRISAKVGIALYPNDGVTAETLYRNAEAALKKAKASSEGVLFYSPRMTEAVAQKLALENKLRQALENEEFLLYYQPKVDVRTRRIEGVEALIRWSNPELGLVPPLQFIPLMEETGLILDVGAWALRRAVLDHKHWLEEGLSTPRIAVNVSAVQLRKHDFVDTVLDALKLGAASPGIDIEITESLIMEDIQGTIEKLHALRTLGIDISIDDFGTGYSSLAYLAKLPVQVLKIDRAFISTMLTSADNMSLVSMMIGLAHALRLKVVAEGVEVEEEAKMLNLLRCDQMQGYLVGKPVPFEAMSALIRNAAKRSTVWADL